MPPARKRKATGPAQAVGPSSGDRRRSGRLSEKSGFFATACSPEEEEDDDDDEEDEDEDGAGAGAGYGTLPAKRARSRRPGTGRGGLRGRPVVEERDGGEGGADEDGGQEHENVDEEIEDFDEEAPGKLTFIPLPKMRPTGAQSYEDDRLHPNTLLFLKDLKANNKRTWLKMHDGEYRRSLKDWESYVATLTEKITAADETIPELPFKDVNFRIYRDIRFSKNPTPYKTHYGAAWSRTGRKGPYACYYVHCEPGACFVGGGLWHPEAAAVARLRASIDERPARWRRVLGDPAFCRTWLPQGKKKEEQTAAAAKRAFAAQNQDNALKTKPKGFDAEHRDVELLRLRNFTVSKKVPDTMFTSETGQEEVVGYFRDLVAFVTHLNSIVMPDPDADSDDDEDDEV